MTDVAISIVNMNNRELLLMCLRSLASDRGRRAIVETVVLDNASEDGSAEAVRKEFPDVRVIAQPFRAGFGANHNTVVRATRSRYVFILNEDTEVPPGTIDALVDHLNACPEAAAAGPRIMGPGGQQQNSAWRLMTIPVQLAWALTLGQRGAVVSYGSTVVRAGAVSACALLVRRDDFERAGGFDEGYFMFSEEADLAKRLGGKEMHYLPSRGYSTTASSRPRVCPSARSTSTGSA
jgi:GT2 family glycosyltransferase